MRHLCWDYWLKVSNCLCGFSAVSNAKIQEEETNEDSVCPLPKELLLSWGDVHSSFSPSTMKVTIPIWHTYTDDIIVTYHKSPSICETCACHHWFWDSGKQVLVITLVQLDQMTVKMWLLACSLFFTSNFEESGSRKWKCLSGQLMCFKRKGEKKSRTHTFRQQ